MSTELPVVHPEFIPARDAAEERFLQPGRWWKPQGERILCELCPRACLLKDGDRGFCFVRQNIGGEMFLTTYGRSTGFCVDPIEKKPLNHFYPGTSVLSFGTAGCNLGCKFCQNWDISKSREIEKLSAHATPEAIAEAAVTLGCRSVAFTYNDPVIWAEYALDAARACHDRGVKTVAVTAGYITREARADFYAGMDAANVDLKAFTEEFYYKLTLSHLAPVLETLRWLKRETDVWFEITNLVIPDANDDAGELQQMCDWLLDNVGDAVPVHFTAFHPDFRMLDRGRTPAETLVAARDIALKTGLKYVYTGNVDDVRRQSTYCGHCGELVIERNWYELGRYHLDGNRCRCCHGEIPGHFADRPGNWGRKRQPVNIADFANVADAARVRRTDGGSVGRESSPSRSTMTDKSAAQISDISDEEAERLAAAASELVLTAVQNRRAGDDDLGELAELPVNGVFVSLKRKGKLRSCCGSFSRPGPLRKALQVAAQRAAKEDPRFPPISPSEVEFLDLEVWLLYGMQQMTERGEDRVGAVEVGRHGLQVVSGGRRGLLLPAVPVEHGWSPEEFLNQTCIKAGLPPSAWKNDETTLLRFSGRAFSRPLVPAAEPRDDAGVRPLASRQFAQYVQHCRSTIETLMSGGVATYLLPGVDDAEVSGACVAAAIEGGPTRQVFRITSKGTLPLQSTQFALCEQMAAALQRAGVKPGSYQIDLSVFADAAMHGSLADPDRQGIDPARRAVMVIEGQRTAIVFNRGSDADQLIEQAARVAGISEPEAAQVLSFAVQSTAAQLQLGAKPTAAAGQHVRPAAVAGRFYPHDPAAVSRMLDEMLGKAGPKQHATACLVPHAGWQFSGRIAADVLKRIELPRTIIAIGPKHTAAGVEWAVAPHDEWAIPGGRVQSDAALARRLAAEIDGLELDAAAHQNEHGVEVELPIIHRLSPETRVVGIALGGGSLARCEQFADELSRVIAELPEPPLLLISSDMNHYADDAETRRLDELALQELDRLDPDGLFETCRSQHISMCGMRGAVIVLNTLARLNRLTNTRRIAYATSADVSGDTSRCVGYAGLLFE